MSAQALPHRFHLPRPLLIALQVLMLALIWVAADFLSHTYLHAVPSGLLGLGGALLLLSLRLCRREWLAHGAGWLISEMLLFFVPAVIAIVQYPDLIRNNGLAVLVVILASTVCVMVATALAVDLTWRLQDRIEAKRENAQ